MAFWLTVKRNRWLPTTAMRLSLNISIHTHVRTSRGMVNSHISCMTQQNKPDSEDATVIKITMLHQIMSKAASPVRFTVVLPFVETIAGSLRVRTCSQRRFWQRCRRGWCTRMCGPWRSGLVPPQTRIPRWTTGAGVLHRPAGPTAKPGVMFHQAVAHFWGERVMKLIAKWFMEKPISDHAKEDAKGRRGKTQCLYFSHRKIFYSGKQKVQGAFSRVP